MKRTLVLVTALLAGFFATQVVAGPVGDAKNKLKAHRGKAVTAELKKALVIIEDASHDCINNKCAAGISKLQAGLAATKDPAAKDAYQKALAVLTNPLGVSKEGTDELLSELEATLKAQGHKAEKTAKMKQIAKGQKRPSRKEVLARKKALTGK